MKKIFYTIPYLLILPTLALAQTATIQFPTNFTSDILSQATALLNSLSGYMTLIIGVLLGLVVVEFVIGAIRHRQ
jgi:fructose-specific phosphotransferase system IIC component